MRAGCDVGRGDLLAIGSCLNSVEPIAVDEDWRGWRSKAGQPKRLGALDRNDLNRAITNLNIRCAKLLRREDLLNKDPDLPKEVGDAEAAAVKPVSGNELARRHYSLKMRKAPESQATVMSPPLGVMGRLVASSM